MICKNCGKEFEGHKRKFCERRCSKRFSHRKRKGYDLTVFEVVPEIKNKPVFLSCLACGKEFRRTKNGGPKGDEYTKCCSRKCGSVHAGVVRREIRLLRELGSKAKRKADVRLSKYYKAKREPIELAHKEALEYHCRDCGIYLEQVSAQCCRNYCVDCRIKIKELREGAESYKINKRELRRIYKRKGRQEGTLPRGNDKARANHYGVEYEHIKRKLVFDKHGWKCANCGIDTPKELKGTKDKAAPELDHIVPISKGGAHLYSNVQLLCKRCNANKSDTVQARAVA